MTMTSDPKDPALDDNDRHLLGQLSDDPFDGTVPYSYESATALPEDPESEPARLRVVGGDTRAEIILSPNVHETVDAMAAALPRDQEIYQRSKCLVHVVPAEDQQFPGTSPGSPTIRNIPLSLLQTRISRLVRCMRTGPKKEKAAHVQPAPSYVRAVSEQGHWPGVRTVRGIIETPSLRPDGTVIQTPGYDAQTGYVYIPGATVWKPILEAPTLEQCVRAYEHLSEIFVDFPYVNGAHKSAVLAAVLTLIARPAILGSVPLFLFDASASRSGKSLQVDVISLIATGRLASRMSYPESDEELEKVLGGFALRGASVVNFDNVARKFGGAALDKVVTAVENVDLRVLGSSDVMTVAWRAVIFASGNNVTCRGDMLPRVLAPRLETLLDNPEARIGFRFPDLRAHVRSNRVNLARAALTIARGYFAAGSPDMGCPVWGGFEPWARFIPHALRWVGADDPMGARRGLAGDEDPTRVYEFALVEWWRTLCRRESAETTGLTIKQALTVLYPPRSAHDPQEPDGYNDLREAIEALTNTRAGATPDTRRLGDSLRRLAGRPVNGCQLRNDSPKGGSVARWRVASTG